MTTVIINKNQDIIKLNLSDIYYIRTHPEKPHYVQVITADTSYDVMDKLKNWEINFSEDLARCHRNCLVNISQIREVRFQEKEVILGNSGQYRVKFSRRRYGYLRDLLLNKGDA